MAECENCTDYARGTPSLNYARYEGLFRVIRNVRAQPVENFAVMAVSTPKDFGGLHAGTQRPKDPRKRSMKQLAAKFAKLEGPGVLSRRYTGSDNISEHNQMTTYSWVSRRTRARQRRFYEPSARCSEHSQSRDTKDSTRFVPSQLIPWSCHSREEWGRTTIHERGLVAPWQSCPT